MKDWDAADWFLALIGAGFLMYMIGLAAAQVVHVARDL